MSTRSTSAGILVALISAATFATSGPFAKSLLATGWTPGSVVFLRIAVAALLLLVPTVRALDGRWHLLRREWGQVVAFGLLAVALPQLAFFYAVGHLSVGVALLLEYLGLVLVVAWQCRAGPPAAAVRTTVLGIVLALVGLALVLDVFGGVRVDGIGVAWGLLAAIGLGVVLPDVGPHARDRPATARAGRGWSGRGRARVRGPGGRRACCRWSSHATPAELGGSRCPGGPRCSSWAVIAAATPYVTGIAATRVLGAKLASFVGLSEVLFAVLFAWVLLGELPRPVQLVGGLFILAGVVAVRAEESRPARMGGRDLSSAVEADLAVGVPLLGDGPIVADDRVQRDGVDVAAAQHHRGVVGAVQEQRPA